MGTVFDIPPPAFPTRLVIWSFELKPDNKIHAVFESNTRPFQAGFVAAGIKGRAVKLNAADAYPEYSALSNTWTCRTCRIVLHVLQEVLHGSPVIIPMLESEARAGWTAALEVRSLKLICSPDSENSVNAGHIQHRLSGSLHICSVCAPQSG